MNTPPTTPSANNQRDESDAARMQPAGDATRIDTTELDVEDVVDRIERLVRARV